MRPLTDAGAFVTWLSRAGAAWGHQTVRAYRLAACRTAAACRPSPLLSGPTLMRAGWASRTRYAGTE